MKNSLKNRAYGLLLGLLLSSINIHANSSINTQGRVVINLAGKQRMLTQKMSKEALLIIKNIKKEENQAHLKQTIALFEKTLYGLRDGDKNLHLPKTEDKNIIKQLNKEIKLWKLFRIFLHKIVNGKEDKNTLKAVEMSNMPLLILMDRIVHLYEKKYSSHLSLNIAKTINLAGRERMLIQKMTKELLLIANHAKSDEYRRSLLTNGQFFQKKLYELLADKKEIKDKKLLKRIDKIKILWDNYQNMLMNMELSQEGVRSFHKNEKRIINKMTQEIVDVARIMDIKRYHINLTQTEQQFDSTLTALIKGNKRLGINATSNKAIQQQLRKVKKIWSSYQPIIKNIDTSKEGLTKAMNINMPLLKEMDKAVKLYEKN